MEVGRLLLVTWWWPVLGGRPIYASARIANMQHSMVLQGSCTAAVCRGVTRYAGYHRASHRGHWSRWVPAPADIFVIYANHCHHHHCTATTTTATTSSVDALLHLWRAMQEVFNVQSQGNDMPAFKNWTLFKLKISKYNPRASSFRNKSAAHSTS